MESEVDAPQPRCKIASAEEKLQLPLLAQSHGENVGGGGGELYELYPLLHPYSD